MPWLSSFDFFQCHQTINYPLHCGTEVHGCLHYSRGSSGHNLCGSISSGLMYLSNTSDPFTYFEKAVAAVFFKEPAEKADTSDAKKKKE